MVCLHHSAGGPMFQHRIKNHQELMLASSERHLLGLPREAEA